MESSSRKSKSPSRKSRSPLTKSKSSLRESKSPLIKSRSPLTKSKSSFRESKSPSRKSRSPLTRPKSSLRESKSPLIKSKSSLRESKSSLRESKSPLTKSKSSLRESKSSLRESKSPLRESKSPLRESKSPLRESKSPLRKSKSSLGKSRSPLIKLRSSLRKSRSSLRKSRSSLRKSKSPLRKSESPLTKPKSPLVRLEVTAAFDDLRRHQRVLQNDSSENHFLKFVRSTEKVVAETSSSKHEKDLEKSLQEAKYANKNMKLRLMNARRLLDMEKSKLNAIAYDKEVLENKVRVIVDAQRKGNVEEMNVRVRALGKLLSRNLFGEEDPDEQGNISPIHSSFYSEASTTLDSIVSASELNFTGEDEADLSLTKSKMRLRKYSSGHSISSYKRKSNSRIKCSSKKCLQIVEEDKENLIPGDDAAKSMNPTPPLSPVEAKDQNVTGILNQDNSNVGTMSSMYNTPVKQGAHTPFNTPLKQSSHSLSAIYHSPLISLNIRSSRRVLRHHVFFSKIIYRIELVCPQCERKLRFGKVAYKCKDCKSVVHYDCRDEVPLPCVPILNTPGGSKRRRQDTIADYSPRIAPMVPALLVHSTNEIERRGLGVTGLYRVPGSLRHVKELRDRFMEGKCLPNLTSVEILVIADTIKSFLLSLKEPVIPLSLWRDFIAATNMSDEEHKFAMCYQSVSDMPQPNRDTLAWIMCHLQKVAQSEDCQMPISNLSTIFGPAIIGNSVSNPSLLVAFDEIACQKKVIELLLNIPTDYWQTFINVSEPATRSCSTPANGYPPLKKRKSLVFTPF